MSDSLWPHGLQRARPPCPSPTPGVHPNPCPLNRWCHPAISSSLVPFSSCPQSFPASGCFQMSQLFASGGQSIRVSASASVPPMNTQDWSLGWTRWISLQSKGLSRVFSNTTVQKHQFFGTQLSSQSNSHIHTYMTTAETVALTIQTFVDKVMLKRSHMFWCHFFHPIFFVLIILLISVPLQSLKHCPSIICGLPSPTPNISHLPYSFSLSSFCLDIIHSIEGIPYKYELIFFSLLWFLPKHCRCIYVCTLIGLVLKFFEAKTCPFCLAYSVLVGA